MLVEATSYLLTGLNMDHIPGIARGIGRPGFAGVERRLLPEPLRPQDMPILSITGPFRRSQPPNPPWIFIPLTGKPERNQAVSVNSFSYSRILDLGGGGCCLAL